MGISRTSMRTVSSSFSSSSQVSRRLNLREVTLGKKSEASLLLFLFVKTEQITTTIDSHAPASNTGRPPRADKEKEEEKRVFLEKRVVFLAFLSDETNETREFVFRIFRDFERRRGKRRKRFPPAANFSSTTTKKPEK